MNIDRWKKFSNGLRAKLPKHKRLECEKVEFVTPNATIVINNPVVVYTKQGKHSQYIVTYENSINEIKALSKKYTEMYCKEVLFYFPTDPIAIDNTNVAVSNGGRVYNVVFFE